jgi:hypothetical protein
MVLVVYAVGQTQYKKLLLEDIDNADSQLMQHNDYDIIIAPMALLTKQMMNGHNNANCVILEGVIKLRDADI